MKAKEEFAPLEEVEDEFALLDEKVTRKTWWVTRKIPRIASCIAMDSHGYGVGTSLTTMATNSELWKCLVLIKMMINFEDNEEEEGSSEVDADTTA